MRGVAVEAGANKLRGVGVWSSEVENFLFLRLSINQKYKKAHNRKNG